MERLAKNNGAQAYLVKSQVSGDDLDRSIQKLKLWLLPNRGLEILRGSQNFQHTGIIRDYVH